MKTGTRIIAVLGILALCSVGLANELLVPSEYPAIQAAIDAANNGDTVIVAPGTYYENINFKGKNITITSINPEDPTVVATTTINGGNSGTVVKFAGTETADCILSGITIKNGNSDDGGGISGNGTHAIINHCVIRNNFAYWGGGITGCNGTIRDCIISHNSTNSSGGGLSYCNGKIINCVISHNSSKYWGGGMEECSDFIGNCTIVFNSSGWSCGGVRNCKGVITNCIVWGNQYDELYQSSPPTYSCIDGGYSGEGNINAEPMFVDPASDDYRLQNGSPCIDMGTNSWSELFYSKDIDGKVRHLDGNNDSTFTTDMGAYEYGTVELPFIAVQPTRVDFIVAQDAIDFPQQILTIWNIGVGMLNWQISGGTTWLKVSPASGSSSGENDEITLTADAAGLTVGKYTCMLMVVDNNAAISPVEVEINLYIYLDEGSPRHVPKNYPTIQMAIDFANNGDTVIVEPGIYNENINFRGKNLTLTSTDPHDKAIVESTVICGDGRDSVVKFSGSEDANCEISGFTITGGHSSFGGGINGNSTYAAVNNCIIRDNIADFSGGGLYKCDGKISRCIITHNSSNYQYYSGGGLNNCYGSISNCLISYNSADEGGGIGFSDASITNCTIVANTARLWGGLRYCQGKINNCIIWGNTSAQIDFSSSVKYSCVQGGWGGQGNIDVDPCFIEPGYWADADDPNIIVEPNDPNAIWYDGDYHLLPDSLCINAGDPNYVAGPNETDLDGRPRVLGGRIDMGAYEFNYRPVADAGPNQVAYAFFDGYADVNLNGSGSYDDDNDPLDYYWSWTIDSNDYEANGVSPAIQLPVGKHTIELVVDDGIDESEPDYCTIEVIAPLRANLFCIPHVLNRKACYRGRFLALISMPPGVRKADINLAEPLVFYPGRIESQCQFAFEFGYRWYRRTYVWAWFDKSECIEHLKPGINKVNIVGKLTSGRYYDAAGYLWLVPAKWYHWPHPICYGGR